MRKASAGFCFIEQFELSSALLVGTPSSLRDFLVVLGTDLQMISEPSDDSW